MSFEVAVDRESIEIISCSGAEFFAASTGARFGRVWGLVRGVNGVVGMGDEEEDAPATRGAKKSVSLRLGAACLVCLVVNLAIVSGGTRETAN